MIIFEPYTLANTWKPFSHDSCFCFSFELRISSFTGRSFKHFTAIRVVAEAIEFSEMWHSRRLVCRNAFQYDPLSLCKTVLSFFLVCFAFSTYTLRSCMSWFPICFADGRYSGMTRSCPRSSPRIIISLQTLRAQCSELEEDVLFDGTLWPLGFWISRCSHVMGTCATCCRKRKLKR